MNEVELLREVVRSVVAERRAWNQHRTASRRPEGVDPKDWPTFDIAGFFKLVEATDRAIERLAEANPGIVYG